MRVADIAHQAKVEGHVVRYYARLGLLRPQRDQDNGYRLFADEDLIRLRFIRQAQALGYRLAEIRQILSDADRGRSPCPRGREILRKRIEENRRRLSALQALQQRMQQALSAWDRMPDQLPDGEAVCHLIAAAGPATLAADGVRTILRKTEADDEA